MNKQKQNTLRYSGKLLTKLVLIIAGNLVMVSSVYAQDPFSSLYNENCIVCHGELFEGNSQGPALVGKELVHGDSVAELVKSIAEGFPENGMPGWSETLDEIQIRRLAIFISEQRASLLYTDFKVNKKLVVPEGRVKSELTTFRMETIATGIDPTPFSIAPLADGRILVTEKRQGIRIINKNGEVSDLLAGTPETTALGFNLMGLNAGRGWMLDVAPHPDYEKNGWIYLVHTHVCEECKNIDRATMNRLVRGRIRDGAWVDQEVIWKVAPEFYTQMTDLNAGGRLAFDPDGYVFLSVGMKGPANYFGIQDLSAPYGKVHRVHDDGRIPSDNPFLDRAGAMPSIWTYGHRSPQGLEFNAGTGELWGTEMGPRGGDEVNLLQAGKNYGWPLYSKGINYVGTAVEYGKQLGIELDLDSIEQPVVDLTPSPAVSSFIIYNGSAFPEWRGNLIVGTLKATELYRVVIENGRHVRTETLISDLARIRDVETGPDGRIYLLLEHESGAQVVALVPADAD